VKKDAFTDEMVEGLKKTPEIGQGHVFQLGNVLSEFLFVSLNFHVIYFCLGFLSIFSPNSISADNN
jgi:hypothetical protein